MSAPQVAHRTYLEMRAADSLRPAAIPAGAPLVIEPEPNCPTDLYRRLYLEIGAAYHWVDRAGWTDEDISEHLAIPGLTIWIARVDGELAGFFELREWSDGAVEIAYFGLLPAFVGRGLGGALLAEAVRRAWDGGPTRVWLHTSSLDHPAALANYQARGFEVTRVEPYQISD